MDPFRVLGVTSSATAAEIKNAFKRLSLRSHPDVVPAHERAAAEARFKEISAAYDRALALCKEGGSPGRPLSYYEAKVLREARYGQNRSVWMHASAVPLLLAFAGLGALTVYHVNLSWEKSRAESRIHGLMGPTVNPYLRDDMQPRVQPFNESPLGKLLGRVPDAKDQRSRVKHSEKAPTIDVREDVLTE